MNARAAGIVEVIVNVVLGLAFVHSGAAAWLWECVERDVAWRTGPTAVSVITFFGIYWGAWGVIEMIGRVFRERIDPAAALRALRGAARGGDVAQHEVRSAAAGSSGAASLTSASSTTASFAARAFIASCVILATQVLIPAHWLPTTLASLLLALLLNAYIVRESRARTITAWAWSGAGLALATLLVHPWFIGQPLFIVRLAVVMTLWDWIGARLGVTPRLMRLLPSLYGGSGCTAAQARVAR